MSPRDLVYVGHMLDMARKAVNKTQSISRADYDADENLRLALIHLIQVIGEAGRRDSRQFCDEHPEVPWADIIGMRHKMVHDYLGVDEDIVWKVVTGDLPKLTVTLERIVPPQNSAAEQLERFEDALAWGPPKAGFESAFLSLRRGAKNRQPIEGSPNPARADCSEARRRNTVQQLSNFRPARSFRVPKSSGWF